MENKKYEATLKRIENLKKPNRKAIFDYLDELKANGVGYNRRIQVGSELKRIATSLDGKFLKPDKSDVIRFMNQLSDEQAKDRTRNHYVITLKAFYKWLFKSKEPPEFVDWLKLKSVDPVKKPRIDRKTVINLIEHMRNQRDKVLTMLLYESGMRFGEAVAIKRKDVSFSDFGMIISVAGREEGAKKTGPRKITIVGDSIAELKRYLPTRPEDPEGYIFPMIYGNSNEPCNYDSYSRSLKHAMKEIGLDFNLHAHLFRSNYASDLVERGINQAILERQLGWSKASKTARFYIDVTDDAQRNGILKAFGKQEETNKKQESVELKICPRCNEMNPSYAKYCGKCWMPLIPEEALKMEEKEKKVTTALTDLISTDQKVILQSLPEDSKKDLLTLLLLDLESKGQLDLIKKRMEKPEGKDEPEKQRDEPKPEPSDEDFNTGIVHRSDFIQQKNQKKNERLKSHR